jgi:hypothetical protein
MSTTVSMGDFNVTSNSPAADVVASLTPVKEDAAQPKVIVEDGQNVEEKARLAKAAAELGKAGGKAAAEKRAAAKDDEADEAKRKVDEEITAAEPADKKKLASDRVQEATRAAAAAKREAAAEKASREQTERRLAELEKRSAPPEQPKAPAADDGKPKVGDFEDHADFVEALASWKAEKIFAEQYEKRRKEAAARYQETHAVQTIGSAVDKHLERVAAVKKGDPSYKENYYAFMDRQSPEVQSLKPSFQLAQGEPYGPLNAIADELIKSEMPRELMEHLSANPDEIQRLAALPNPQAIIRAVGRLEARLEGAPRGTSPSEPEVSKANPPVRPVTGSPHIAEDGGLRARNLDEYSRTWKPSKPLR